MISTRPLARKGHKYVNDYVSLHHYDFISLSVT